MGKKNIAPIIYVIIIVLVGIFIFYKFNYKKTPEGFITIYGNVDIRQVDLSFRVSGRIKKMLFDEGDLVKPGNVIALLDEKPYLDEIGVNNAEIATAEANYMRYKNGSRPQEIQAARALVKEREAAYENAVIFYERQANVVNKGSIAKQDYDNALSQTTEAAAKLKSAQEQLSLVEEGFRKEDILASKAQVETAKANLELAKTNLRDTKIITPNEGIILTRIQEPGAVVEAGAAVYTLSLKKPVWVRTYVSETDLGRIYPGMKADVYTDSQPKKPYEGHIGFISPVAEFTPKNVETTDLRTDLVYRLRVIINNPDNLLRQGMPVTVKLILDKKDAK